MTFPQALPVELITIPDTRKAVKAAKTVLVQIKYGLSEGWIKISKKEALSFLAPFADDATPEDAGMYGSIFASIDGETVFLG